MRAYFVTRVVLTVPVILVVAILSFLAIRAAPGDVVGARLAESAATPEQADEARRQLGIDDPLPEQLGRWLADLAQADFGDSLWTGEPTLERLQGPLRVTIEIGLLAVLLGALIGIPLGTISAVRKGGPADLPARLFGIAGLSVPDFFIALLLIIAASRWFAYFPPIGFVPPWENPLKNAEQVWMPVVVLGVRQSAAISRITRSSLLEVLNADYVRTAKAKGLRERTVVLRHALRNALISVVTLIGVQLGLIVGATAVVENIFALPGLGQLTLESVLRRDYTQLQTNILILASVVVAANLIVDLAYGWLDPRLRTS